MPDQRSVASFRKIYLMVPFQEGLAALKRQKPSIMKAARKAIRAYAKDVSALERRKYNHPTIKLWRTKIGGNERIIDEPLTDESGACALLFVGHKQRAYPLADKYEGFSETAKRNARKVDVTETESTQLELLPTKAVKRKALLAIGVPDASIIEVPAGIGVRDLTRNGASEEAIENLHALIHSVSPATEIEIPVPGTEEPKPLVIQAQQLHQILRLPLEKFLARLTPRQEALARRKTGGLQIIKGAAGCGKTIIAIKRIQYLLEQRDMLETRPIVFVCYNRVLRNAVCRMLSATIGKEWRKNVQVLTAHELVSSIEKELQLPGLGRKAKDVTLEQLIRKIRQETGPYTSLRSWDDREILAEIREVIYGRVLLSEEEYHTADREGRGVGLPQKAREDMWSIYKHFRAETRKAAITCWQHAPARLVQILEKRKIQSPRYAAVVIDETQDLSPSIIRAIVALQAGRTESMLILGDAAQNVYSRGFRWAHLGLRVAGGEVTILRSCFRSTEAIIRAATPLVAGQDSDLADDLVLPEATEREESPEPELRLFDSPDEEYQAIALQIVALLCADVPASSIAILVDSYETRKALARVIEEYCPVEELYKPTGGKTIDIGEQSVKLMTTYSAKGLEFPVVFLPCLTNSHYPGDPSVTGGENLRTRRMLYTAMLRAGRLLYMSATQKEVSPLVAMLGPNVDRTGPAWPSPV